MPDTPQHMTFNFKPAKREGVGLFIGLAGGTGSGKTYSALALATGIAGPNGKIAAGDTEGHRMSHYDKRFKFDVVDLTAPFRPEKFESLAKDAEAKGYKVLIIDSFSHEHAGDGGVLEWHDEEIEAAVLRAHQYAREGETVNDDAIRNAHNMRGWIKPKGAHKAMINSFLQRRIAIIFCMRAEEKIKVLPNGKPQPMGWMPICDKNFGYELTCQITLSNERPGVVDYKLPRKIIEDHLPYFPDGKLITAEAGAKLAAWARGDDEPKAEPPPAKTDKTSAVVDKLIQRLAESVGNVEAFDAILAETLVVKQRDWMKTARPDQATRLDEAVAKLREAQSSPPLTDDQGAADGEAGASIPLT
jgi:hypothetical protein